MAADRGGDGGRTASAVRDYYEGNTRLFLSLGIGGKTLAMRRAVWAAGVQRLSQGRSSRREGRLVLAFQEGWILSSLCTVGRAADTAAAHGLRLVEGRNLSPSLSPLPVSAPVIESLSILARALPVPWSYWRSTAGSLARAACQKAGLVEYRYLVFQKGNG